MNGFPSYVLETEYPDGVCYRCRGRRVSRGCNLKGYCFLNWPAGGAMKLIKTGDYLGKVFMVLIGPTAAAPIVTKDKEYRREVLRLMKPVSRGKNNIVETKKIYIKSPIISTKVLKKGA